MGRYSTVQTYTDQHAGMRAITYQQATGGGHNSEPTSSGVGGTGAGQQLKGAGGAVVHTESVVNPYGSTAGAGSGEFHVYRHARAREMERQKHLTEMEREQQLDHQFQDQVRQYQQEAELRTSQRRAKRQKRKAKQLQQKQQQQVQSVLANKKKMKVSPSATSVPSPERESVHGGGLDTTIEEEVAGKIMPEPGPAGMETTEGFENAAAAVDGSRGKSA